MPILKTDRKITITGDGSTQLFNVFMSVEKEEHLVVYEGDEKCFLNEHYTIPSLGFPSTEITTVQWIGRTRSGRDYTFVRVTPKTQPEVVEAGVGGISVERGINRVAIGCQESLVATEEVFDADGARIQNLGTPLNDKEAAHHLYTQSRFSKSGNIAPPIADSDEDKLFYCVDTETVGWKNAFTLPTASTADDIMRVQQDGSMDWENSPTYTPALPATPKYLSVNDDGSTVEWRNLADLPDPTLVLDRHCIACQEGGSVAWEEVRDIPPLPTSDSWLLAGRPRKFLLQTWTKHDAVAEEEELKIANTTYIESNNPTNNYSSSTLLKISVDSSVQKNILMKQDVSSLETNPSKVAKATLCLYKRNANNDSNTRTAIIGRLKQDYLGIQATWNNARDGEPWNSGGGAINDIDYEIHCMPLELKGKSLEGAGKIYEYDITYLYLDAIKNRDNELRIMLYVKELDDPNVWTYYWSDDARSASMQPYIKVTSNPVARTARYFGVDWGKHTVYPTPSSYGEKWRDETVKYLAQPEDLSKEWNPDNDRPTISDWEVFKERHNEYWSLHEFVPYVFGDVYSFVSLSKHTAGAIAPNNHHYYNVDHLSLWSSNPNKRLRVVPCFSFFAEAETSYSVGLLATFTEFSFFSWSPTDLYSDNIGDLDGTGCG